MWFIRPKPRIIPPAMGMLLVGVALFLACADSSAAAETTGTELDEPTRQFIDEKPNLATRQSSQKALESIMQAVPHLPQLARSALRFLQVPEQSVWPWGQAHVPAEHCLPPAHLVPHLPQLLLSVCVSVQAPEHSV